MIVRHAGSAAQQHAERPDDADTDTARDAHANDRRHAKCAAHSVSFGELSIMAIDVKSSNYELGKTVTYVTVNGVTHAVVRADAWFEQIGSGNAPAPRGKSLSVRLRDVIKNGGKSYGVLAVKLALNPDHRACHAAVNRVTHYPADQPTFTAVSRKKPRPGILSHGETGHTGRGKVGVGGMRTRSHS
ncbi:hypothetical protein PTKU46_92460 [Paraburkholderia terrae]|uniref:hypothetical protein n=1 Tax=Paraburkholderia terrae TaxID=311230 RepID=UPI0030E1523E